MTGEYSIFIKSVLDDPKSIGTAFPASNNLASKMVENVELNRTDKVLEINPSTGNVSRQLLTKVASQEQYFGIEQDAGFTDLLKETMPFATFETGKADDYAQLITNKNWEKVDYVFSGRPINTQDDQATKHFLEAIAELSHQNTKFITFQYLHSYKFAKAEQFRWLAQEIFGPLVQTKLVLINFLPAFVFTWERKMEVKATPVLFNEEEKAIEKTEA
ncbi:class I SAM-dependent methyltransferase [Litoribacillus peritrichatus]|uniref:rRNA adenine N-6-methyltransferase family protein n=1 Tax=Litoribacillus peritrichatus TaxID=718191 RepID=A0ABP7MEQ8_9GAMM